MRRLAAHYGGCAFDVSVKTKVFNPWSVLNCLNACQSDRPFRKWWRETSGMPQFLHDYLRNRIHAEGSAALIKSLADPDNEDEVLTLSNREIERIANPGKLQLEVALYLCGLSDL